MNIQTRSFDSKRFGMAFDDSSADHDYTYNHSHFLPKLSDVLNIDNTCTLVKHLRKISIGSSSSLGSSVENIAQTQPTFPQVALPSPIPPIRSETPPIISICQYHSNIASFYCWMCKQPYCGECGVYTHSGHPASLLHNEIEKATGKSNKMMVDIQTVLTTVNSNIQCVKEAKASLRNKVQQEKTDLMAEFYIAKRALEDRYHALFEKLNKSTNQRAQRLLKREHTLLNGHRELTELLTNQRRAGKNTLITNNPLSLLIANDIASRSTLRIERECWDHMVPYLDNLTFDTSAKSVLDAISDWGRTRCIIKPGAIGDKRVVRGPADFNEFPPPLFPNPRGRPVHGSPNAVVIWTEQTQPTRDDLSPIKLIGGVDKRLADDSTLNRPWGVACDRNFNILVADRSNHRILILKEDGTLIQKFGEEGSGPGQFNRPAGIAVDTQDRIVVVDKDNNRIQIFTMEGGFLFEFGKKGAAPGRFNCPWDVATNTACEIVVSDTRNDRIQLFSSSGQFLRMFGGFKIDKSTWFKSARGVAFRPDGCVVVTDMKTHDIIRVDPDFTTAQSLPVFKTEYESLYRPQGIIVDDEGNTIVSDSRNCCIRIFDKNGLFRSQLGTEGVAPDQIDKPYGIALLPDGRVVFVDSGNNRIVIR